MLSHSETPKSDRDWTQFVQDQLAQQADRERVARAKPLPRSAFFDAVIPSTTDPDQVSAWRGRSARDSVAALGVTVALAEKHAAQVGSVYTPEQSERDHQADQLRRRLAPLRAARRSVPEVLVVDSTAVRLDDRGARSGAVTSGKLERVQDEQGKPWYIPQPEITQDRFVTVPRPLVRVDEWGEVHHLDAHNLEQMTAADVSPHIDDQAHRDSRAHRARLFSLRDVAAKLKPDERVCKCGKVSTSAGGVDIKLTAQGGAFFDGVQTCGSVWHCPVCARKITEARRVDMQHMAGQIRAGGGELYMLTITAPHERDQVLRDLKTAMTRAYRYLVSGKYALSRIVPGYVGTVRALEVTHGANGWHVHFHVVLAVGGVLSDEEVSNLEALIFGRWCSAWKRHGLGDALPSRAHGVQLQRATVAGDIDPVTDYVCKWGVAEEMTKLHTKKAVSDTPWTLLEKYQGGNKRAGAIWREYADVFKGGRQLVWSAGFRAVVGLADEVPDEVTAAAVPEADKIVTTLLPLEWLAVRAVGSCSTVLDLAERGPSVLAPYVQRCTAQFAGGGGRSMPERARIAARRVLVDWLDQVRCL